MRPALVDLLDEFAKWLLDHGYTDTDILGEGDGSAVEQFISEREAQRGKSH